MPCLFGVYQDGISDRHEIIKNESLGDNWYCYDFYDKGVKGAFSSHPDFNERIK